MTEIMKLKEMLEKAGIPHVFKRNGENSFQICYPADGFRRKCSVIQSCWSYGGDENLLEIMGLLTETEREEDAVLGWLSAEEVYKRIEKNWNLFGGTLG